MSVSSSSLEVAPFISISATPVAVLRSKNGSRQSTEFSNSLPGMRRASGVRIIRPSNWVMWVRSLAGRIETSTSARGQSQPVEIADFASSTRTCLASCTRCGSM